MERTTVYLPLDLKLAIKAAAKRQGSSEAQLIREALGEYVAKQELRRPRPKSIGIVRSGRIQSEHLEDWLAENWERDW